MGRLAFILVLALVLTAGIVSYSLNTAKRYTVENVVGFEKYTSARNFAHTGVNLMLHQLDIDTSIITKLNNNQKVWIVNSMNSGICSVSVKLKSFPSLDTVDLTSKAIYGDTVYNMRLSLQRSPKPFPTVGGAVSVRASPVQFTNNGQPIIDGRNYTTDGVSLTGAGNKPGILCMTHADSLALAATWGFPQLNGSPNHPVVDTSIANPATFVQEYINGRDYFYPTGTYSGVTWGTPTKPVIVDCVTLNALETVNFTGSIEGWGVLIVRGNLKIDQNFKFHGLVLVYGDNLNITVTSAGNAQIIGGLIIAGGPNTLINATGNSYFKYSSAALNTAKYIPKLLAYQVMKWYE